MNAELKKRIEDYLNSFGDDEQLSIEDITDLLFQANTLLSEVVKEEPRDYFNVSFVAREDIELAGFDASKLDADDMQRIASKMGDLICDCCDYWNALEAACDYWEIPRKED